MLHTRWAVMAWENATEYSRWYERNVNEGTVDILKIEIHFQNNLDGNEEYFRHYDLLVDAGLGKVTMEKKDLLEYHLVAAMEADPFIAVVPGTGEWFPKREAIDYLAAGGGCPICKEMAERLGLTSAKKGKQKKATNVAETPAEASKAGDEDVEMEDAVGGGWQHDIVMR